MRFQNGSFFSVRRLMGPPETTSAQRFLVQPRLQLTPRYSLRDVCKTENIFLNPRDTYFGVHMSEMEYVVMLDLHRMDPLSESYQKRLKEGAEISVYGISSMQGIRHTV